jgi:hypothetical protein
MRATISPEGEALFQLHMATLSIAIACGWHPREGAEDVIDRGWAPIVQTRPMERAEAEQVMRTAIEALGDVPAVFARLLTAGFTRTK